MTDTAAPRRTDDETEILEKLRAHFQTKVDNLSGDEMAEGPFEDGTEFGDAWEAAAAVIDRRGGLRIRFEYGDAPRLPEIDLIAAERSRVLADEGRTPEGDDTYEFGQLLYAAAAYIGANVGAPQTLHPGQLWPWGFRHFKPADPVRNLVKAGQLIAAEIARLQRAAQPVGEDQL